MKLIIWTLSVSIIFGVGSVSAQVWEDEAEITRLQSFVAFIKSHDATTKAIDRGGIPSRDRHGKLSGFTSRTSFGLQIDSLQISWLEFGDKRYILNISQLFPYSGKKQISLQYKFLHDTISFSKCFRHKHRFGDDVLISSQTSGPYVENIVALLNCIQKGGSDCIIPPEPFSSISLVKKKVDWIVAYIDSVGVDIAVEQDSGKALTISIPLEGKTCDVRISYVDDLQKQGMEVFSINIIGSPHYQMVILEQRLPMQGECTFLENDRVLETRKLTDELFSDFIDQIDSFFRLHKAR